MSAAYRYSLPKVPYSFSSEYPLEMHDDDGSGDEIDLENLKSIHSSAARRRIELMKQNQRREQMQIQMQMQMQLTVDRDRDRDRANADNSTYDESDGEDNADADISSRSAMSPSLHAALKRKQQQQQQQQLQQQREMLNGNRPQSMLNHGEQTQQVPRRYSNNQASKSQEIVRMHHHPNRQDSFNERQSTSSPIGRSLPAYSRYTSVVAGGSAKSPDRVDASEDRDYDEDTNFISDKSPKEVLRIASQCLQASDDDWETRRRGLNLVRHLARSNSSFLQSEYRPILPLILIVTKNLRTQLSRVAIRAIGELLELLGRAIEQDVDRIVEQLLVRFADTNKFIHAELEACFASFSTRVRADLGIPALIRIGAKHKSTNVRAYTAQIVLQMLTSQLKLAKVNVSTIETVRTFASAASQDADPSVRQYGRELSRIVNGETGSSRKFTQSFV